MTLIVFLLSVLAGAIGGVGGNVISDGIHDKTHKEPQQVIIVQPTPEVK